MNAVSVLILYILHIDIFIVYVFIISLCVPLRKCVYAIYRDFYSHKNEYFSRKCLIVLLFFAQNIDCGYMFKLPCRGGSNEYP